MMVENWTAVYERQDQGWIAYCAEYPASGVVGHTLSEARKQLREVMDELLARQAAEAADRAGHEVLVGA